MCIQRRIAVRMPDLDHVTVAHHAGGVIRPVPNLHIAYSAILCRIYGRSALCGNIDRLVLGAVFLCDLTAVRHREQVDTYLIYIIQYVVLKLYWVHHRLW